MSVFHGTICLENESSKESRIVCDVHGHSLEEVALRLAWFAVLRNQNVESAREMDNLMRSRAGQHCPWLGE